jgi:ABC-2 type transport system permease protein
MSTATLALNPALTTKGANPISQLGLWVQWNLRAMSSMLPFLLVIQAGMSALTILGYSLLIGDEVLAMMPQMAVYITTGAVTMSLLLVGLVIVSQGVSEQKSDGSFNWLRTMPMPRWVFLVGDLVIYSIIAIPGAALALLIGALRFDFSLNISPWLILAAPLVTLIGATMGYSVALLLDPKVSAQITQLLLFFVMLFSPLSFPATNLPGWLLQVHRWLPFEPMADFMRFALMGGSFTMTMRGAIVLTAWTLAATTACIRVLRKRS